MSYGDSVNWDGVVPSASDRKYTIDWRLKYKANTTLYSCTLDVITDSPDAKAVAAALAAAWTLAYPIPDPHRAIHAPANPNRDCCVQFIGGEVSKMWIRGYEIPYVGLPPAPPSEADLPFRRVERGVKTPVLFDSDGGAALFVFNS